MNVKIHTCPKHCLKTDGSFICACDEGFVLQADERSCKIIDKVQMNKYLIKFLNRVKQKVEGI